MKRYEVVYRAKVREHGQAVTRLRQETYTTREAAEARRHELNSHRHHAHVTDLSEQRRRGARSLDEYAADWIAAQRIKVASGKLKARTLDEYAKLFDRHVSPELGHLPIAAITPARRAQENGIDFVKGVATAITPMAFFETVMVRGYETLVDPDTKVDVNTGMIAAGRLQALIDSRAGRTSMADILFKMDRIINAIHDTVPPELWEVILHKIGGPVPADTPTDEIEDWDGAEDMYDPMQSAEADEDCWTATAERDSAVEGRRAPTRTIEAPSLVMRQFTPMRVKDDEDF